MLTKLSLDPLLDQEFEGRHRDEHVLNSEVPYVRYLDWLDREYVRLNQPRELMLPLSVYKGTWTHSPPLVAMHLLDISCVIIGFFFEIACHVPQQWHPSEVYA